MKFAGGEEWFTAAELAGEALPGLPKSKRKINEDWAPRWALQVDGDGVPLARKRQKQGGGLEFHVSVLPAAARAELAKRGVAVVANITATPETSIGARWAWFERLSDKAKDTANFRLGVIARYEALRAAGMNESAAVPMAVSGADVGASTLRKWLSYIKGVERSDRLPYLAPQHVGGGATAVIDDGLWQHFCSDYLRLEKPTLSSCYYRAQKRYAEPRGLTMPSERAFRRKIERDLDPVVVIFKREGSEALRQTLPALQRTVAGYHAMELVNIDGHKWDVFVRWPDGSIARPITIGIQDVYSRKMLAWSTGKVESAIETRLAFAHLFERYGIPKACYLDNGRAFASKWITGGAKSRFRFKIRDEEPLGLLTQLGIENHWTKPYRGQSKPIERAWRDFADSIAKDPEFAGAYTGNKPDAKPENYGSKAVPLERFLEVVEAGIAAHNARPGRRTEMGRGLRSLDEVFAESYATASVGQMTPEKMRLALLAADDVMANSKTGAVKLHGNLYWHEDLVLVAGKRVTVRFDPDDLHAPVHVYARDTGEYLCSAPVEEAVGFDNVAGAKAQGRREADYKRAVKALTAAENLLDAAAVAAAYKRIDAADVPEPGVARLVPLRGQTARQLKTTSQAAPRRVSDVSQAALMDRLGAGMGKLRAVK